MQELNVEIFDLINKYAGQSHIIDIIAIIIAKYLIFLVPLYLIWMFLRNNDYCKHQSLFAFYSGVVGLLLNFLITLIYFHPRPFMVHIGTILINHMSDSSFPSDHTTLLFSLGFYLLLEKQLRIYGAFISIIGLIVGIARIFCGIHWPLDIVGSIVTAYIAAMIVFLNKRQLYKINKIVISIFNNTMKLWRG